MKVTVYSKPNCHLCDEAMEALRRLQRRGRFALEYKDISNDPALLARYEQYVPAIFIDGIHTYSYRLDEADFVTRLEERPT